MDKAKLNQIKQDITRLQNAADRLLDLRDAYMNTLDDLRIAQQGLKYIATWAKCNVSNKRIHDRAMDTLSLISEANRG